MPLAPRIPEPSVGPTAVRARRTRLRGRTGRRPQRWLGLALIGLASVSGSGCQTLGNGPLAAWYAGRDDSLSKGPTATELGDDRNFMARWFRPKDPTATPVNTPGLVLGSDGWRPMKATPDPEGEAEFRGAEDLFRQGQLAEAEAAFAKIAKKRKGTEWGEKSQFHVAETQFQRGKYVAAHDSFEVLKKDYPGTEFNDKLIDREYKIAQVWLAQSDPQAKPEERLSWNAKFTGAAPLIDPRGHAVRALEHVRHHNPNGPLADDAVMRIADTYMEMDDWEMAAIYYDQLITDHPKSPFLQRAQLAAIDARMKAYVGPEYDGSGLDKARELVKQTLATFPDKPANNEKLYHTLDLINDQKAERTYVVAEYYKRTGKVASAEFYYGMIPQKWPKSPWAVKAKTELASLARMPRELSEPSKIMTQPGSYDPYSGGGGGGMPGMGMGGMGGMGMPGGPG